MILIDAIYICQTGGKNLLDLLIDQFEKEIIFDDIVFLIDDRIKDFYINKRFKKIIVNFLKGSELNRFRFYLKNGKKLNKVFCFANVPPPLRLDCVVMTYFQNVILIDSNIQKYFSLGDRLKFRFKKYIIKTRSKNTDYYIVQTSHVKDLIVRFLNYSDERIEIIPFFNDKTCIKTDEFKIKKENDFFFPATGTLHKNHDRLLKAWSNLNRNGIVRSSLHLTIDKQVSGKLYQKITELQEEGVSVINHGILSKSEVDKLYDRCRFVIHPSLGESFGLVLIEAIKNNCILLAPDLPYVNAIVKPNYYFNASQTDTIEKSIMQSILGEGYSNSEIKVQNELERLVEYILK